MSKNHFYYKQDAVKEGVSVFDGVKVYAHQYGNTFDHRPEEMTDPNLFVSNLVGFIDNVRVEESTGVTRLVGDFHCTSTGLRDMLKNTWEVNQDQMPGFSIDADVQAVQEGGKRQIEKFIKANSVDIVTYPSAGGAFERMVASIQKQNLNQGEKAMDLLKQLAALIVSGAIVVEGAEGKTEDEIIAMLSEKLGIGESDVEEGYNKEKSQEADETKETLQKAVDSNDMDEIKGMLTKLLSKDEVKESDEDKAEAEETAAKESARDKRIADVERKLAVSNTENMVNAMLGKEAKMPEFAKTRVKESFSGRVASADQIKKVIDSEKKYLDHVTESAGSQSLGSLVFGDAPVDKMQKALDMLFDDSLAQEQEYKGIPEFLGIREAVQRITGVDVDEARRSHGRNIKESTTADFPIMLGDSMNKKLVKEYNFMKAREIWTKFVTEESFTNLNTQKMTRVGGFGELPTVAEDAAYSTLSTPSEDNPTYTPVKKGGTFSLTEEMLINDDLRGLKKVPKELARAAIQTLNIFVYNLLLGRGGSDNLNSLTIYDGGVLYSAAHGNLATSALGATSFETAMAKMANQEQADSGIPIGLQGKYLLTPYELRKTAWDVTVNGLTQANANGGSIQNAQSGYNVEPLVLPNAYAGGVSNFWILIADPMDIEGLTVGYLGNKKQPEVLLQDNPTVATVFTNDRITYRTKFRFGGAIADYRAFQGYMGTTT